MKFYPKKIMPAPHWFAVIKESSNTKSDEMSNMSQETHVPLICWALGAIESPTNEPYVVHGMVMGEDHQAVLAVEQEGFMEYVQEVPQFDIEADFMN